MLQTWADISLIVFGAIFSLIAVGALVVMAIAVKKLELLVENLSNKAEPVIIKASDTLDTVHRVTVSVGEKADHILARGEVLTESVSQNIETTANTVQSAVTGPLISLSSLITGVTKGFSVWGQAATHGVNGTSSGSTKK